MRACVADENDQMLRLYKEEHPAFRKAAYREALCPPLWYEMDRIVASGAVGA